LLLKSVSKRLSDAIRKTDTVARMGGDEFLIIIPAISAIDYIETVAKKIIKAFHEPFLLEGHVLTVTTSIGISIYPDNGIDIDSLIKTADISMYEAKKAGRNNYQLYSTNMDGDTNYWRNEKSTG